MEENKWRDLWERCSGSVYQSWEWAEINRAKGKEPIFLAYETDNKLKAGILCFSQNIKTPIGLKKVLFSEGTPLFSDKSSLIDVLKKYKEESKKYFYGLIQPTFFNYDAESFAKTGFHRINNNTIFIPLSPTIKELFNGLEKKSARWGVKKAEKGGVKIFTMRSKKDLEEFYEIYKKTSENQFSSEPLSFFDNLSVLEKDGFARFFIAKHNNELMGGVLLLLDYNYGVISLTSVSENGMNLQAMNLLYWEMIKYCKEKNKKLIDLGGYSLNAKQGTKMYNINKFKENFGGQITEQPAFSTSKKYTLMHKLRKKFDFIKKLYKKEK